MGIVDRILEVFNRRSRVKAVRHSERVRPLGEPLETRALRSGFNVGSDIVLPTASVHGVPIIRGTQPSSVKVLYRSNPEGDKHEPSSGTANAGNSALENMDDVKDQINVGNDSMEVF